MGCPSKPQFTRVFFSVKPANNESAEAKPKKSTWQTIKAEAHHYWIGTKLLGVHISTAGGLVRRVMSGHSLSRRERRQLLRTTSDLLRLVPFAFFLLIPFMELMIPIVVKFFPNFLPTTYTKDLQKQANMKRQLKARIEVASFLQDSMEDYAQQLAATDNKDVNEKQGEAAKKALRLVVAARKGWYIPTKDVLQLASLFRDYVTLDGLNREQLVALCRYMNVSSFGSDSMLRVNIRRKVRGIKADDQSLWWEGIDGMTKGEMRTACQERGMRSVGLSRRGYERLLNQWLHLSVSKKVSPILLLLSGALNITAEIDRVEAIEKTVISLDDNILTEVVRDASVSEDKSEEKARRLETIKYENDMIAKERLEKEQATATSSESTVEDEATQEDSLTQAELSALEVMASDSAVESEREELNFLLEGEKDVEQLFSAVRDPDQVVSAKHGDRLIRMLNNVVDKIEVDVDTVDKKIGKQMRHLDLDGDGVVTASEVHKAIKNFLKNRQISDSEAVKIVSKLDLDGDGKVTLRQLEDLKTVLQQQEEIENEKVKSDGVGDSWPDPRDSIRI